MLVTSSLTSVPSVIQIFPSPTRSNSFEFQTNSSSHHGQPLQLPIPMTSLTSYRQAAANPMLFRVASDITLLSQQAVFLGAISLLTRIGM